MSMSRFRFLLLWLVMAAIPLQGLAAASMLYCGMGAHDVSAQSAVVHGDKTTSATASGENDHSKHGHAEVSVKKSADNSGSKLPDASHKCGVCASCCHSAAIAEFPRLVAFAPLPQAELAEPFVLIHARPSQVPDKPPRV